MGVPKSSKVAPSKSFSPIAASCPDAPLVRAKAVGGLSRSAADRDDIERGVPLVELPAEESPRRGIGRAVLPAAANVRYGQGGRFARWRAD